MKVSNKKSTKADGIRNGNNSGEKEHPFGKCINNIITNLDKEEFSNKTLNPLVSELFAIASRTIKSPSQRSTNSVKTSNLLWSNIIKLLNHESVEFILPNIKNTIKLLVTAGTLQGIIKIPKFCKELQRTLIELWVQHSKIRKIAFYLLENLAKAYSSEKAPSKSMGISSRTSKPHSQLMFSLVVELVFSCRKRFMKRELKSLNTYKLFTVGILGIYEIIQSDNFVVQKIMRRLGLELFEAKRVDSNVSADLVHVICNYSFIFTIEVLTEMVIQSDNTDALFDLTNMLCFAVEGIRHRLPTIYAVIRITGLLKGLSNKFNRNFNDLLYTIECLELIFNRYFVTDKIKRQAIIKNLAFHDDRKTISDIQSSLLYKADYLKEFSNLHPIFTILCTQMTLAIDSLEKDRLNIPAIMVVQYRLQTLKKSIQGNYELKSFIDGLCKKIQQQTVPQSDWCTSENIKEKRRTKKPKNDDISLNRQPVSKRIKRSKS